MTPALIINWVIAGYLALQTNLTMHFLRRSNVPFSCYNIFATELDQNSEDVERDTAWNQRQISASSFYKNVVSLVKATVAASYKLSVNNFHIK